VGHLDQCDHNGSTALRYATQKGHYKAVQMLLDHKPALHVDMCFMSALDTFFICEKVAEVFLDYDPRLADIRITSNGCLLHWMASRKFSQQLTEKFWKLSSYARDPGAMQLRDFRRKTPFHRNRMQQHSDDGVDATQNDDR